MDPGDSHMAGPDDPRGDRPAIFERSVVRHRHAACDSVVIEAVTQREWTRIVAPVPAVAAVDVVPVVELVVDLDVELVIRRIRRFGPVVVIEFVRVTGLRVEIKNSDSYGILLPSRYHASRWYRRAGHGGGCGGGGGGGEGGGWG